MQRKINEPSGPAILKLYVKAPRRTKCKLNQCIVTKHSASVILLQETHTTSNKNIKVYGFSLNSAIHHAKRGIATVPTVPLYQHPAIYSRDFSCHPGGIHPTTQTEKLYMTGHILQT